jgi:phosphonate transport system ATP-binding protein
VLQNVMAGQLGRLSTLGAVRALVWPPRDAVRQVHEILERVGIPEKLFASTDRLSGGQRQRVAFAPALFQQPVALLADEPVSSVDPARARDLVQLLVEISAERGLTLCVSLHNLELAREYFPRVVGLRQGRIAFDGPPSTLAQGELDALFRLETAGDRA